MDKDSIKIEQYNIEYTRMSDDLSVSHHIRYFVDYFKFASCLRDMLDCDYYKIVSVYKD